MFMVMFSLWMADCLFFNNVKILLKYEREDKMNRKCISMIVVFAFLHYLVAGCTKTTTVQQEELSVKTTECCVHEVILTTGEKYEFERPGGRYNVVPDLLTGTLNDGRKFFF